VTDTVLNIWRLTTNDPATGTWDLLQGAAYDIAVSPTAANNDSYAWHIGTFDIGQFGDHSIHALDQQPAGPGSPAAPWKGEWVMMSGGAIRVTVGSKGQPWFINALWHIVNTVQ